MNPNVETAGDVASPAVVSADPVGIPGSNRFQEVLAQQVTTVVRLTVSSKVAISQAYGL